MHGTQPRVGFSLDIFSVHEVLDIVNHMTPLDDVMRKNTTYLALKKSIGGPGPLKADLFHLQVYYLMWWG